MIPIIETTRLQLREFNLKDTKFILQLLNTPNWLQFIGDKQVKSLDDAKQYINSHLIKSYKVNGYGLWLASLKDTNTPIGMCGLVKREILEHPDIGFAFLPEIEGQGYGFESANAVVNYAKRTLKFETILAITDDKNVASIKLLKKVGLHFQGSKEMTKNENVLVFSSKDNKTEKNILDNLTQRFFEAFTNADEKTIDLENLKNLLIPEALIVNNTNNNNSETYTLDEFIAPRQKLLSNGTLIDFKEYEISNLTEVSNTIANRCSLYKKEGRLNGKTFEVFGQKSFQFIKIDDSWKISSVIWCDSLRQ